MQTKDDLQRQLGGLRSMYERASDDKKSALKASIDKKEAELAKLPSARELKVIKARENFELRQAEATIARTTATQLSQRLRVVQNSRYTPTRAIDDLRRDIEAALASETAKGKELESAKDRLAKAEGYLQKGQAARQGQTLQEPGLPSHDAVQSAPPTATKQPEHLQEAVRTGNADLDFGSGDEENDEFLQALIEAEIATAKKNADTQAAQAAEVETKAAGLARTEKNRQDALAKREERRRADAENIAKNREAAVVLRKKRQEDADTEQVEMDRVQEETTRRLQQSIFTRCPEPEAAPVTNPYKPWLNGVEEEDSDSEPIVRQPRRRRQRPISPVEDEDSGSDGILEAPAQKKPRLENAEDHIPTLAATTSPSLTEEQRRKCWEQLPAVTLKVYCGLASKATGSLSKGTLITRLINNGTPLPASALPISCKYTVNEIATLKYNPACNELARLRIRISKEDRCLSRMKELLTKFIETDGNGVQKMRGKMGSAKTHLVTLKAQADARLKARGDLAPSGLAQPTFDPQTPTLVVILTRDSGFEDEATKAIRQRTMKTYQAAFEQGRIYDGLQSADFELCHLNSHPFMSNLPEYPPKVPKWEWLRKIMAQPAGSRVVIVLRGIEGLCHLGSWSELSKGQQARGHQTTILFSESVNQWEENETLWSGKDWKVHTEGDERRYWFGCELRELLESDARVCKELREQLIAMAKGRDRRKEGIAVEGRRASGRNK
ncbi:MAG: hypothetical protein Q9176_003341 [Flavoplaca citrina]